MASYYGTTETDPSLHPMGISTPSITHPTSGSSVSFTAPITTNGGLFSTLSSGTGLSVASDGVITGNLAIGQSLTVAFNSTIAGNLTVGSSLALHTIAGKATFSTTPVFSDGVRLKSPGSAIPKADGSVKFNYYDAGTISACVLKNASTNAAISASFDIKYIRIGKLVHFSVPNVNISANTAATILIDLGISNSTLLDTLTPGQPFRKACLVKDNSSWTHGNFKWDPLNITQLPLYKDANGGSFTTTGAAVELEAMEFSYLMDTTEEITDKNS